MERNDTSEEERMSLLHDKHRVLWNRRPQSVARWARCVLILVILYSFLAFFRGVSDLHDQVLKLHATDFSGLHNQGAELWMPAYAERERRGAYIDERYHHIRHLGSGKEGSVDVYVDEASNKSVVVKTYRSVSRNPVPRPLLDAFSNHTTAWPTEIEAGLLLVNYSGFVPVIDYFILNESSESSWALVSAFMSNGTLDRLAKQERLSSHNDIHGLDTTYRPSLVALLQELRPLHDAGLCHDDVKSDNIFLRSPTEWLLGDLGNIRQFSHPWHLTGSFKRQNQWPNCRLNDVRRALKTYLWFLRSSTPDVAGFDRSFWAGEEEWARMYWDFVRSPEDFTMIIERLPLVLPTDAFQASSISRSEVELARATERELICTTIPRRLWPWYWRYAPIW